MKLSSLVVRLRHFRIPVIVPQKTETAFGRTALLGKLYHCRMFCSQSTHRRQLPCSFDVELALDDADRFRGTHPNSGRSHIPVLVDKIVDLINPQDGQVC